MKPALRHALWVIPLAVVAIATGWWFTRTRSGLRVDTVHAVRRPLVQTLVTSGRVVHRRQSELGSALQTTVAEVLVEEGDDVGADALLIRLADEEAQASVAEAEAALSEADARLSGAQGVGRRMASQSLAQARIDATQAQREYDRQQSLFESGVIGEAALERARRDRDATRSRRVSASLEVAASAPTGSDAQALRAQLARAQARLRAATARLSQTQIRAPSAGTVLARHVERGEVVRPGEVLVTFAGDGPLEIVVRPDESNLARLQVGQTALVSPEAFPSQRLRARVVRIAPSVDPARGTIDVALTIAEGGGDENANANANANENENANDNENANENENENGNGNGNENENGNGNENENGNTVQADIGEVSLALRPDMTVAVEVELGRLDDALVVPTSLVRDLGTQHPWLLVVEQGYARRREIRLGLQGDELVEVAEGLSEDEALIPPDQAVDPDDPIRARAARPAVD